MNPTRKDSPNLSNPGNSDLVRSDEKDLADMSKRTQAARELIGRYFTLLTSGCGSSSCTNPNCASSPNFSQSFTSNNEAAAKSLQLLSVKAPFCDEQQPKQHRAESTEVVSAVHPQSTEVVSSGFSQSSIQAAQSTVQSDGNSINRESLVPVIDACRQSNDWRLLIRMIGTAFYDLDCLQRSFVKVSCSEPEPMCTAEPSTSAAACSPYTSETLDLDEVRETYALLFAIPNQPFLAALVNGLVFSAENLFIELRTQYNPNRHLHIISLILELPCISAPELLESALPAVCKAIAALPLDGKVTLCRQWSRRSVEWLTGLLSTLQQLMTLRVMTRTWGRVETLQDDTHIAAATRTMKLVYMAALLGGERDPELQITAEKQLAQEHKEKILTMFQGGGAAKERKKSRVDPLEEALGVRTLDCRKPLIPLSSFVNDVINEHIDIENDFSNFKVNEDQSTNTRFCFMDHPFVLTTLTKSQGLFFDNKIRQLSERRQAVLQSIFQGEQQSLYLRLRVNRETIINDALVNLELVAMESPQDLKKQLYVEFEGEQGIDEGGVSKEFFQLIVEKIFNPDVGMFTHSEETRRVWFNPGSLENDAQFTLIGIVLGLAIYNNVILDVHFPPVIYRKLLGKKGTFSDLVESHPTVASSLQQLLEHEPDRVEEDFMLNFTAGYSGLFNEAQMVELKPRGQDILVTGDNREEFVQLYVDFLLNDSIKQQFGAFKRGFCLVTDESPLHWLFRADELELLIIGSRELNFKEMEDGTDYDGGYTENSSTIKNFWLVMHAFDEEQKKQFLQFTTGSDRSPIGGLSRLRLVIARHGPDSDRLPSAHTCFNVLLLPDYSSKEKLQERLLKAITHATGFGML